MALWRRNIAGTHRAVRIVLGAGVALLAFGLLSGLTAWVAAAGGLGLALTGVLGRCPACAAAGIGKECGS